jgi:hypothetical protein
MVDYLAYTEKAQVRFLVGPLDDLGAQVSDSLRVDNSKIFDEMQIASRFLVGPINDF